MKIFSKSYGRSWLATFVIIAAGNAWFHGFFAVHFVEEGIATIGSVPMPQQRFYFLVGVWVLIASATAYFTLRDLPKTHYVKHALVTGAFVGLVADGTWNFVNASLVPSYSVAFAAGDTSWHVLQGAVAALVAAKVYLWAGKRWGKK
jgi:uncharacterized membrane protein